MASAWPTHQICPHTHVQAIRRSAARLNFDAENFILILFLVSRLQKNMIETTMNWYRRMYQICQ